MFLHSAIEEYKEMGEQGGMREERGGKDLNRHNIRDKLIFRNRFARMFVN